MTRIGMISEILSMRGWPQSQWPAKRELFAPYTDDQIQTAYYGELARTGRPMPQAKTSAQAKAQVQAVKEAKAQVKAQAKSQTKAQSQSQMSLEQWARRQQSAQQAKAQAQRKAKSQSQVQPQSWGDWLTGEDSGQSVQAQSMAQARGQSRVQSLDQAEVEGGESWAQWLRRKMGGEEQQVSGMPGLGYGMDFEPKPARKSRKSAKPSQKAAPSKAMVKRASRISRGIKSGRIAAKRCVVTPDDIKGRLSRREKVEKFVTLYKGERASGRLSRTSRKSATSRVKRTEKRCSRKLSRRAR